MALSFSISELGSLPARLSAAALADPKAPAIVETQSNWLGQLRGARQATFAELEADSSRIAAGLRALGVPAGARMALLVEPGFDQVSLLFALWKAGATPILLDPCMARRRQMRTLASLEPDGVVAGPALQALRELMRSRFRQARFNVTVGRRWFWEGVSLDDLRCRPDEPYEGPWPKPDDPAAILWSVQSRPPKGVLYSHENLDALAEALYAAQDLRPGSRVMSIFPWLGALECARGATAVIAPLELGRGDLADPAAIAEAIQGAKVTHLAAGASLWNRLAQHCQQHRKRLTSVSHGLVFGLPCEEGTLEAARSAIHARGQIRAAYGSVELPIASTIPAVEAMEEARIASRAGAGLCFGRRVPGAEWKVIRVVEGPIRRLGEADQLQPGEIGELIVIGPAVAVHAVTRSQAGNWSKIRSGAGTWRRTGDAGYLDTQGRFWYCGRVADRVLTPRGPLYPLPCEAIFQQHPDVRQAVLVGFGPAGQQQPAMVLVPWKSRWPRTSAAMENLLAEARRLGQAHALTAPIRDFLVYPPSDDLYPDASSGARETTVAWAQRQAES